MAREAGEQVRWTCEDDEPSGGAGSAACAIIFWKSLERAMGIEPTYAAWEAAVLPLNYTRIM